jgi:arginine exporter protein ArgO
MGGLQRERWFYLLLVTFVSASVFVGFAQTYLTPERFSQTAETLPTAVHVHGISFLLWYGLLVLQAVLVLRGGIRLHRWLGTASLALAAVMVSAGILVVSVRMERGLNEGDQFWSSFSLVILSTLVLFSFFYGAALLSRRRPDHHRRYMLLAAATGSGAAQFRSLVALFGPGFYAVPAGILATNLFVVVAMIGDRLIRGRISRIYLIALPAAVLVECAMLGLAFTSVGIGLQQVLVGWLRPLFGLY